MQQQDESLLSAFHLMTPDERRFFLQTALTMTRNRSFYRPKLVLVGGAALRQPGSSVFTGSDRRT